VIGFLYHWFDWPSGSVLTNLIASAVCVGLAGWKILAKLHRMHEHQKEMHDEVRIVRQHQLEHTPKPRQTRKA
jgi:hypothetical protein